MSAPNRYGSNDAKAQLVYVGNLQGQNGITYISGAKTKTPGNGRKCWRSLQAIGDCVFSSITVDGNDGDQITTLTLSNTTIQGNFTRIVQTSGTSIAYY